MRKANTRSVRRLVKQKVRTNKSDVREIPTVVANIIRGMQPKTAVSVLEGREIMGYIQISPSSTTGLLGSVLLNPLRLYCERLRKFVGIYGQYRFKRLEFLVQGNLPTSVGGNLYLGYSRNPDLTIPSGAEAPTVISSMENSMSVSVWSTSAFAPRVDTNEWYNVDDDSSEIMKTCQGVLFMAQGGIYNITGPVEIPVYLTYLVECRGQQVQPVSQGRVQVYPAVEFRSGAADLPNKQWATTVVSGETLAYPALIFDTPYFLSPSFEVPAKDDETIRATIMVCNTTGSQPPGAAHNITLYPTLEEFNLGTPIVPNILDDNFVVSRFTLEMVDPSVSSLFSSLRGMPERPKVTSTFQGIRQAYHKPMAYPNLNPWA